MNKPILLAIGGAVAGVAVAFAAFMFLMGGGTDQAAAASDEVVNVPGKLGPHITLTDRVFNLLPEPGQPQTYLKLQTVVEFETRDPRWEHVLRGCGASDAHGAASRPSHGALASSDAFVSAVPAGRPSAAIASAEGAEGNACDAELAALMAEFEHEIGSGRALIEDVVTTIVTGHTASEIATPAGKDALKAKIEAGVEGLMGEQQVSRVLFLNFITQ